jgi:hypothetical protein
VSRIFFFTDRRLIATTKPGAGRVRLHASAGGADGFERPGGRTEGACMTYILLVALAGLLASPAVAPVKLFVTSAAADDAAAHGFVDTTPDAKLVADVTKEVRWNKHFLVVTDRATADCVLEVVGMTSKFGGKGFVGIAVAGTVHTVTANLVIGDYRKAFEGKNEGGERKAIKRLVENVEAFVVANAAQFQKGQAR